MRENNRETWAWYARQQNRLSVVEVTTLPELFTPVRNIVIANIHKTTTDFEVFPSLPTVKDRIWGQDIHFLFLDSVSFGDIEEVCDYLAGSKKMCFHVFVSALGNTKDKILKKMEALRQPASGFNLFDLSTLNTAALRSGNL